jgi:predicted nicotinamide N-methyase
VLTLDQRAPGAEDAPISVTGDVEPAYTASRVWPASAELARHVADVVRGKRVVELGAGAGLAGLACKVLGAARVVLTDLPENLPLLQRNAARNGLDVSVAPFDWLTPTTLGERFDVVLAADCVFWPELFEPLLNASEAVAAPGAVVLIAVTHRLGRTDAFLEKLRRRGWTASARPRRRDAPQNTDVYEVSFILCDIRTTKISRAGKKKNERLGKGLDALRRHLSQHDARRRLGPLLQPRQRDE